MLAPFNLPAGNHIFHDSICAVHVPICTPFHARSQNLLKGTQFYQICLRTIQDCTQDHVGYVLEWLNNWCVLFRNKNYWQAQLFRGFSVSPKKTCPSKVRGKPTYLDVNGLPADFVRMSSFEVRQLLHVLRSCFVRPLKPLCPFYIWRQVQTSIVIWKSSLMSAAKMHEA